MTTMRWFRSAAAVAAALLLSGCFGGGDEQVLPPVDPSPSETPSKSGSPDPSTTGTGGTATAPEESPAGPPTGIELTGAQEAAFKNAQRDYARWVKVSNRLTRDPQPTQRTANIIKRYTFDPASSQFYTSLQRYEKAGVHIEGEGEFFWRAPLVVNLDHRQRPKITWKQCTGLGSTRVLHGDEVIPQDKQRQLARVTLFAGDDGRWRETRYKPLEGSC